MCLNVSFIVWFYRELIWIFFKKNWVKRVKIDRDIRRILNPSLFLDHPLGLKQAYYALLDDDSISVKALCQRTSALAVIPKWNMNDLWC